MPFDETLAARIRHTLARKKNVEEKKMFGCICFFLNGNALAGVWKDALIARLGPDEGEVALLEPQGSDAGSAIIVENQFGSVVVDKPGYGTEIPDEKSPPSPVKRMQLRTIDNLLRAIRTPARTGGPARKP